ncbi:type II toxin-antitoxin system PemK/MazF family toxin [Longispora sp. K20-0274]|uniref:type II toxin-antitoxin system PemK/MazF family toxin n=1 Tax=Longispora sp. K20-0274 TaxID=3088255 RepID=UPI00399B99CC
MRRIWKAVTAPFRRKQAPVPGPTPAPRPGPAPAARPGSARPGSATSARAGSAPKPAPGGRHLVYSPQLDGQADPGEIVWTWVEYEDDPTQGKDRPVLVVGRDRDRLLGLMLSSQSERDGQRGWLALGPGSWDREQRPSWIRLDRVLDVPEDGIRREGAVLDESRFERIAQELRAHYGWA